MTAWRLPSLPAALYERHKGAPVAGGYYIFHAAAVLRQCGSSAATWAPRRPGRFVVEPFKDWTGKPHRAHLDPKQWQAYYRIVRPGSAMGLVSELTAPGVALIWPAPALDRDRLLWAFAALIVACAVATLPRRWRVAQAYVAVTRGDVLIGRYRRQAAGNLVADQAH
jgi:hypothetical protein